MSSVLKVLIFIKEMPMYKSAKELIQLSENKNIIQILLDKELDYFEKEPEAVYQTLKKIYDVMKASSEQAISTPENYQGKIIGGEAKKMWTFDSEASYTGLYVNQAMARAFSSSEVNASMGKICAAPTAGSCGIIPSALFTAADKFNITLKKSLEGLLISSAIGEIITMNATVSGAEGGCQAECGSAAAMAAGMLVFLRDGSTQAIFNAAAIALKNVMGLICDPIAGLVEAPCAKRNASGVVNAMISADMSLAGVKSVIPFDEVVEAMYKVGKALPSTLKETALGGIAISNTGLELKKTILGK
jgi:L-serine dehydratase